MGRDADDPLAGGEVGREGVAVSSLADMEILFDRIPVDEVTTSMTINGPASIVWAMYLAAAEKRGIPLERLGGKTVPQLRELAEGIVDGLDVVLPAPRR